MATGLRREGRDRGGEAFSDAPADQSPELVQKRNTVTEAYDHGDFEAAFRASEDFLHQQPDDAYVKRVAAVSACALGNQSAATKHYQEATEANKRIIKLRCHPVRHRALSAQPLSTRHQPHAPGRRRHSDAMLADMAQAAPRCQPRASP